MRQRIQTNKKRMSNGGAPCACLWVSLLLMIPSSLCLVPSIRHNLCYSGRHGSFRRRYPSFLLVSEQQHEETYSPENVEYGGEEDTVVKQFHRDMVRVLQQKQPPVEYSSMDRHHPVPVLENDPDGAERVDTMLQHLRRIGKATVESFEIVMKAYLQRGRARWYNESKKRPLVCAADRIEKLLQQLLETIQEEPPVSIYNLVLEAYATCATPRADINYAQSADDLLDEIKDTVANLQSYVHVLHAWSWQQANLKPGDCAKIASELLTYVEQQVKEEEEDTSNQLLLLQCYDWVLEAFSKSSDSSPLEAQAIFDKMKKTSTSIPGSTLPNSQSYSNIILTWSKPKTNRNTMVQTAHDLLLEAVEKCYNGTLGGDVELIAFNGVIVGWTRLNRPDRATELLWTMDKLQAHCESLVPDKITYNSVLQAHVKQLDRSGANRNEILQTAVAIVKHMEEHGWTDQPAIRPDSFTYNGLMKACVKSGRKDAAQQAERVLLKMEKLSHRENSSVAPTIRNYNVVINAHAKNNRDRNAAEKALGILERMQQQQPINETDGSPSLQPDIISFTSVMECLSKSTDTNASFTALKLLEQASDLYRRTRREEHMPNLRTFTMAILCLAKCPQRVGNILKARELLQRLNDMYVETGKPSLKPNEYPYNYVLNCAANAIGTQEDKIVAFQEATKTYQEMRNSDSLTPDSFTYGFWIKACNNLLPPQSELHSKSVGLAFEQCKQEGLVTDEVLFRLQNGGLSYDVICNLLNTRVGYRHVKQEDVPREWSRNASGQKQTTK